eukprot:15328498-Ditylum_brightwellii.AAC.1
MEKVSDSNITRKKSQSTKKQVPSNAGNYNVLKDSNNSTEDQYSTIKMHLDCMLSKYWKEYEGMLKKKLPLNFEKITYNNVSYHNFVSCVCHYLGNNTRQYAKDNKDLLAWKAADQYLSTFKTYFLIVRFNNKDEPVLFQNWKGGDLVAPKEAATEEDRWARFTSRSWSISLRGSLFCSMFNLLVQIGGHTNEALTMLKSDLKAK